MQKKGEKRRKKDKLIIVAKLLTNTERERQTIRKIYNQKIRKQLNYKQINNHSKMKASNTITIITVYKWDDILGKITIKRRNKSKI